jgi:hypothetical protein
MFTAATARTTILAALATAAVTFSSGAPAANAQAIGQASADTCAQWLSWYKDDVNRASQAVTAGQPSQVTKYYVDAEYDLKLAKDAGCSWAATIVVKTPTQPTGVSIGKSPVANAPLVRQNAGV